VHKYKPDVESVQGSAFLQFDSVLWGRCHICSWYFLCCSLQIPYKLGNLERLSMTEVLVGLPQIQHHAIATDVIIICNLEIHIWLWFMYKIQCSFVVLICYMICSWYKMAWSTYIRDCLLGSTVLHINKLLASKGAIWNYIWSRFQFFL
jgi:hypothetical protein